ncbi:hypothetical protein ACIPLA_18150 [Pseudomonas sp. NPDC086112]|uniref:hypothetical protein n=1 Tax=Pseudomonas sp. NPDC086112 TaxID=3364430 RepID=UPI00380EF7A7
MNAKEDLISQLLSNKIKATGTFIAEENGEKVFSAESVILKKTPDNDYYIIGIHDSKGTQEHIALSVSGVIKDGKYTATPDGAALNWSAELKGDRSKVKSGKLSVEFSELRSRARGGYEITLENNRTLNGEFDISRS